MNYNTFLFIDGSKTSLLLYNEIRINSLRTTIKYVNHSGLPSPNLLIIVGVYITGNIYMKIKQ